MADTVAALTKMGVRPIGITDMLGLGRRPGHSEIFEEVIPFPDVDLGLVPKKMLTMFVDDAQVNAVVEAIATIARTGYYGDGRIAVSQVEELRHIHNQAED